MRCRLVSFSLTITLSTLLVACGGGGSQGASSTTPTPNTPPTLTINGTAATGRAIALATVSAKCRSGSATATSAVDGSFQLSISGGTLPCVLQMTDPSDGIDLHSVARSVVQSGNTSVMANITPLSEMVLARAVAQEPSAFFNSFDASTASAKLTPAALDAAQVDVGVVLNGTVNTSILSDFIATPLKAATSSDINTGDSQDQLLDSLRDKLNRNQLGMVVSALAKTTATVDVKKVLADGVAATGAKLTAVVSQSNNTVVLQWSDT